MVSDQCVARGWWFSRPAVYRYYYTGKLELPESYAGLRFHEGSREGCPIDESKYDVFFYPIEAVASGKAAVTESLSQASPERLAVVVSHEDFHNRMLASFSQQDNLSDREAEAKLLEIVGPVGRGHAAGAHAVGALRATPSATKQRPRMCERR